MLKKKFSESASLIIREILIKTTVRDHFTPVRMTIIKKTNKRWLGWEGKETPVHCSWKCKLGTTTMENMMEGLQKIKN